MSIGGMEVESSADNKQVESQSFNDKFKGMIQKMTESPDKANFEKFLKVMESQDMELTNVNRSSFTMYNQGRVRKIVRN